MKNVYILVHKRTVDTKNDEDIFNKKIIGIYSTEKLANEVIELYKNVEGFKDYPHDFIIMKFVVDQEYMYTKLEEPMMKSVFFVQHSIDDGEYEITTEIGIYSSCEKASKAIEKYRKLSKFKSHPEGFNIDEYVLNNSEWSDGFFIYD